MKKIKNTNINNNNSTNSNCDNNYNNKTQIKEDSIEQNEGTRQIQILNWKLKTEK